MVVRRRKKTNTDENSPTTSGGHKKGSANPPGKRKKVSKEGRALRAFLFVLLIGVTALGFGFWTGIKDKSLPVFNLELKWEKPSLPDIKGIFAMNREKEENPHPYQQKEEKGVREGKPRPSQQKEEKPHSYQQKEEKPRPYQQKEEKPRPYQQKEEKPRSYQEKEEKPRPYQQKEEKPRSYQQKEEKPRSYQQKEEKPRPYQQKEEKPRSYQQKEEKPRPYQQKEEKPRSYQEKEEKPRPYQQREERPGQDLPREESRSSPVVEERVSPTVPLTPRYTAGRVALVIDDFGNHRQNGDDFCSLDIPMTFAVLPHLPYSGRISWKARQSGKRVILHLPMENHAGKDPGPGTILADMKREEILKTIREDLESVPGAEGFNNHEGSLITEKQDIMELVMKFAKDENLYFLDSRTTDKSVGIEVARRFKIPCNARNMFIDNEDNPEYIKSQLEVLIEKAKKEGLVIAIGHARKNTYTAIKEMYSTMLDEGIEFVFIGDYVH